MATREKKKKKKRKITTKKRAQPISQNQNLSTMACAGDGDDGG
jgi:hypothetical protein